LKELDRGVVRAVMESDVDGLVAAINEFVSLRQRLSATVLEEAVVVVEDDEARATLKAITTADGLPADEVIGRLLGPPERQGALVDLDEHQLQELGEKLFYSWFSHHEYVAGLAELRPMVLRVKTSDAITRLVHQARDCYAFQQYDAAYGLCRIVIEASVRDICVRKQLLPDADPNVALFEKYRWKDLRRKVSSGALEERLRVLYADLSVLVHGRKSVTGAEARLAFEQTLAIVEDLYAANGL
jgi:hypothetical protein